MEKRKRNSQGEAHPMDGSCVRTAFDTVAGHISNVDQMKDIVEDVAKRSDSMDSTIKILEALAEDAEVTLRTDIRILINECRHLMAR
ncbi:hypothetical protein EU546_05745 [Candidatus Thorarchaeota archaeon]|nr:MAG: hypothetical protein EU546_05745 [Candidatus Thorarchaeota archaeon]